MNNENTDLQTIPLTALEAITRGEIDTQIRTAKQYPRSMKQFLARAIDLATAHVEIAESFIYVKPVGKKDGKMQYAEGLSVRAAEIVGATYGNLRVGSMIVEQTDRHVVTRGYAHDLETNFASTSENKEATVTKEGRPFTEGMRATIAKASLAKARRDATFQVVPKALCRPIETAARALIAGDSKSLDDRRANAVQFIQRLNIVPERVWAALGIQGPEEMSSETLLTLSGIRSAIKDGETSIDDAFPNIEKVQAPIGRTVASPAGMPAAAASKEPAKPVKSEPSAEKPTPTQTVANLIKATPGVTESGVVAYCIQQEQCDANAKTIEHIGDEVLLKIIELWPTIFDQLHALSATETTTTETASNEPEAPEVLPADSAQVLAIARGMLMRRDIDEKDALRWIKSKKACGAKCAVLGDVARSALERLVRNPDEMVAWVNENHE